MAPQESVDNRRADGTFGPGNLANPGGRPKGSVGLRSRLRRLLADEPERAERALTALADKASEGDVPAIKLLLDSVDGLLTVKIEGLSEDQLRAKLTAVMVALKERLPSETHAAVADAFREVLCEDEETE